MNELIAIHFKSLKAELPKGCAITIVVVPPSPTEDDIVMSDDIRQAIYTLTSHGKGNGHL